MIQTINPHQFTTVLQALTDADTVYIVPTFQRPYAWEKKQIIDLLQDMTKANARPEGSHYLSALHLIPLDLSKADDPLAEFIDGKTEDIIALQRLAQDDRLKTAAGTRVRLYAVVDGQQRLTTLLLLAHIYSHFARPKIPSLGAALYLNLIDGTTIPRLIQNPWEDHAFMKRLISWISNPTIDLCSPGRQSQRRMLDNCVRMRDWHSQHTSDALDFLASDRFRTSAIELEPAYGLTSFLTLNDRGKNLTTLEKIKSLVLQFAFDANDIPLIRHLHYAFGGLYQVLDDYQGLVGCQRVELLTDDDGMVRLLSCYLRLDTDKEAIEQGAESAYEEFFRKGLSNAASNDVTPLISKWCCGIEDFTEQLKQLMGYLTGKLGGSETPLHECASIADYYRTVLVSLKLQPHLLALLLKFRARYHREWHERFVVKPLTVSADIIPQFLSILRQKTLTDNVPQSLLDYLQSLSGISQPDILTAPKQDVSMLEAVERMQILNWNLGRRWYAGFVWACQAGFQLVDPAEFVHGWAAWGDTDGFIRNILDGDNETNFRYLLKEYERSFGNNLHFDVPRRVSRTTVQLEHVFAEQIEEDAVFQAIGGFEALGISGGRDEFNTRLLQRSGNLTWLSQAGNAALSNKLPNIKAAHYLQCDGHPQGENVCSAIAITRKLGGELIKLGAAHQFLRVYIEARCAELALFAVRRFC